MRKWGSPLFPPIPLILLILSMNPEVELKPNWVHLYRIGTGSWQEGVLLAVIDGECIWEALPFASVPAPSRNFHRNCLTRCLPIIEWGASTTYPQYRQALAARSEVKGA